MYLIRLETCETIKAISNDQLQLKITYYLIFLNQLKPRNTVYIAIRQAVKSNKIRSHDLYKDKVKLQIVNKNQEQKMQIQKNKIDIIAQLPSSVIVHDLSFDWAGKRIAAACSDKTIRIYQKRTDGWVQQNNIKISGASVWKVKWARPQFGIILATCSLDRNIRIYELKRVDKSETEKNDWISIHNIQQNKSVQDIKFIPNKNMGLCLAVACSDGYLKIYSAQDPLKLREWGAPFSIQVNPLGLNCLSWSKNQMKTDESIVAVGCKSFEKSPKKVIAGMKMGVQEEQQKLQLGSTISFVIFNKSLQHKQLQKLTVNGIKQTKAVNDISWALMNGRSYYLLGVAGDAFLKIFQINIRESGNGTVIQVLKQIKLSQTPCYRVSWNVMGTYISTSQKKRIRVWRAASRGNWHEVKQIEE